MDLRLLSRFIHVAETNSINKAAARLNLSQPALTKSIQLLEERMGVTLIVRGPRGISLTEVGQMLLKHAKVMEAEIRKLDGEISAFKNISLGRVSIGVPPGPGFLNIVMPIAARRIASKGLRVTLDVSMGARADLLRPLLLGDLDFIIAGSGDGEISAELVREELYPDRRVIAVAAKHPLAAQRTVTSDDLRRFPWAILKQGQFMPDALLELARGAELSHSTINSNSTQFVKVMLMDNHWIGLMTLDSVRVELQCGQFVELKVQLPEGAQSNPTEEQMMEICYRRDAPLSSASARLMREIKLACADQYNLGRANRPAA